MKRLTKRNEDGSVMRLSATCMGMVDEMYERLCEYEEIGYSPEQVREMSHIIIEQEKVLEQFEKHGGLRWND